MADDDIGTRAELAAAHFLASLGVALPEWDAEIMRNAYVVGWIQGAYAGANEYRPHVCKRRLTRRHRSICTHDEKG